MRAKKGKKTGLKQVRCNYPELYEAAMKLYCIVCLDVKMRNVATHETFLSFGLAFDSDYSYIYEIDSVLTWKDPRSEEGMRIEEMVRDALRRFAHCKQEQIGEFISAAHAFVSCCDAILCSPST